MECRGESRVVRQMRATEKTKIYLDFDSCYYNLVRAAYNVAPWTIITNKFNHVISAPHWMEGHFGVKKIAYLAPPVRVKLKTKCFVEVFNIDVVPNGRNVMTGLLASILERVKVFAPDASIVHKDSIVAEVEQSSISMIRRAIAVPCTIGVGCSAEEAKDDCRVKKAAKKKRFANVVTLTFYTVPMIMSYLLYLLRRKAYENRKDFHHACSSGVQ